MGFNYGLKKRKFTEEWKKLYREYKAAGMSEEDRILSKLRKNMIANQISIANIGRVLNSDSLCS